MNCSSLSFNLMRHDKTILQESSTVADFFREEEGDRTGFEVLLIDALRYMLKLRKLQSASTEYLNMFTVAHVSINIYEYKVTKFPPPPCSPLKQ